MKKVLITGFTPFGGETLNPAYEAIKNIKEIDGYDIKKMEVETAFFESFEVVKKAIDSFNPDYVLLVGQAGGRPYISIEKIAINYINAAIPDNYGKRIVDEPILKDGPDGYFSTLPNRKIIEKCESAHVTLKESYSAGTYVCNYLMYEVLNYLKNTNTLCSFIHVPYIEEQVVNNQNLMDRKMPYMSLSDITFGLTEIIKSL